MNDVEIVHILKLMSVTGLKVAGPVLGVILAVGVGVSLVQTITQVQEQAVVYVMKFAGVATLLLTSGPWMLQVLSSFVRTVWAKIPDIK